MYKLIKNSLSILRLLRKIKTIKAIKTNNNKIKQYANLIHFSYNLIIYEKHDYNNYFSKLNKKKYKTILYYKNGSLKRESNYKNRVLHKIEKPADKYYYKNGFLRYEMYYINGLLHRNTDINGFSQPAIIEYYKNGNFLSNIYYKNGNFFREFNLPEIVHYNKNGIIDKEIFWNDIKNEYA
jgi:antitoxin component YwqK of YwqJK toxin-antitoxin module